MLHRSLEMSDEIIEKPIVSICVVADKLKCPASFSVISKTFDDGSDADLWKEGFAFGIFGRVFRYICINYQVPSDTNNFELLTDLAIISEKEAVPSNFVCIDYTADTKEKALKKKYLCARFTPRNDTLDAITDICVLSRLRKPPKGYTSAGDVDGMMICYKVATIPDTYGRLRHSQSTILELRENASLYPNVETKKSDNSAAAYRHSTSDLDRLSGGVNSFTIKSAQANGVVRGIDGVPFQLNPLLAAATTSASNKSSDFLPIPNLQLSEFNNYNFSLERSIAT